jgi:serine/threonine-protein kinase
MVFEDQTGTIVRKICMACSQEFTGLEACCPHDGNLLVPLPQDPYLNKKLANNYLILSVIGTGGMGVVYKAKHEVMDRFVAIKMLRAQFVTDSQNIKRFQQEAKAASRLDHSNVVTLYDYGVTDNGQPYLVMDYIEGISLAQLIKEQDHIGVDRAIHIFVQACNALDHAHKKGVIHRDLKPGNIMLVKNNEGDDCIKVVDFGVAKLMPLNSDDIQILTQTGEVCGSPVYMSPEQCLGHDLDIRADIYSMGIVIYHTLTGKVPLKGRTLVETMSKQINETAPSFSEARPDLYLPPSLESIIFKALSKEPYLRQQSMSELAYELESIITSKNKSLRTIDMDYVSEKPVLQKPANYLLIALLIIIALFTTFFFVHQNKEENRTTKPLPTASIKNSAVNTKDISNANRSAPIKIIPKTITVKTKSVKPISIDKQIDPFIDLKKDRSY